jgi:biopolymer transport protein ExbD
MRPWWCVFLLAGLAAGDEEAVDPKVALPVAPKAGKPASVPKHPPLVVTLTKKGRILVSGANLFLADKAALKAFKVKPGLTHVSLDVLSSLFAVAAEWYAMAAKTAGRTAFKDPDKSTRVFLRKLHIRADKDAPWAFVQWTAMVAVEQKVSNLQLALERKRTLDLPLPVEDAWLDLMMYLDDELEDVNRPPHIVVQVRHGDPTRYRVAKEETTKPDELEATLRKRLAKTKPAPKVVVRVDLSVPFQSVVTAFDRIYAAGAKEMWWLGRAIPGRELREKDPLPQPKR